ncbi:MAG: AIM24 family protein [Jatrophihabitantaceae bacterium]
MTFEKVNSKVVKVNLASSGDVLARKGAMLFYTGNVRFTPHGPGGAAGGGAMGAMGGIVGMAGRAMAGEHQVLMAATGDGEVHYGRAGLHVTVVALQGDRLVVESSRLLAHTANLQSAVVPLASGGSGGGGLRGMVRGAVTGQGMFTTQLSGHGAVVLLSHGGTFELPVRAGVFVDPQAYVGHLGNVQVKLAAKVGWRDAVGRGGGEAMQLEVSGDGVVYVQASEQKL